MCIVSVVKRRLDQSESPVFKPLDYIRFSLVAEIFSMVTITASTKKLIEENPLAFATVDSAHHPNVIGVAYVKVVWENQLLITDNYMKQTKENIENNNHVCCAVRDNEWHGVKLVGTAEYFTSGPWKEFVEHMEENTWLPAKGAILLTLSEIIPLG